MDAHSRQPGLLDLSDALTCGMDLAGLNRTYEGLDGAVIEGDGLAGKEI
jgi:hypothetical protein